MILKNKLVFESKYKENPKKKCQISNNKSNLSLYIYIYIYIYFENILLFREVDRNRNEYRIFSKLFRMLIHFGNNAQNIDSLRVPPCSFMYAYKTNITRRTMPLYPKHFPPESRLLPTQVVC